MKESQVDLDSASSRSWYKPLLDATVTEMISNGVVSGVAIEATPVWMALNQVLIARIWEATRKTRFIWAIAGERVKTDYISGNLAASAQEAAKHFALKWQGDSDRLKDLAKSGAPLENPKSHMEACNKLIGQAEFLYDLAESDDIWRRQLK